jgi:heptose I phosphotransferase
MADNLARRSGQDAKPSGSDNHFLSPSAQELLRRNGFCCADDFFTSEGGRRLDKSTLPTWRTRLALDLLNGDGRRHRVYLKRYYRPPLGAQLRRIVAGRRSTADVERHWSELLQAAGIAVPGVLAFCESTLGWLEKRSAILLSQVPGDSLERLLETDTGRPTRSALRESAKFIAAFHRQGFIHRDLYACHLFVDGYRSPHPRFALIDLQRVMHRPMRFNRWRVRDIAQLDYSVPKTVVGLRDRLRWLKEYLGARRLDRRRYARLIRRIAAKSASIAARDARRKRAQLGA